MRRDLVLDIVDAVASEDGPAVFELAGRAVESGYNLRQVCRELARAVRDLLVVSIDPNRAADPEIAQESERARLQDLATKFSYEDLMRAFDVLARAEFEIRGAAQPRYHLEMALLKWIHLRKLVPLADVYYFAADQKYTTLRHAGGSELIEDSLRALEEEFGARFIRVHRNALVQLRCIAGLERDSEGQSVVVLRGIPDRLQVSRRLVTELRERLRL